MEGSFVVTSLAVVDSSVFPSSTIMLIDSGTLSKSTTYYRLTGHSSRNVHTNE